MSDSPSRSSGLVDARGNPLPTLEPARSRAAAWLIGALALLTYALAAGFILVSKWPDSIIPKTGPWSALIEVFTPLVVVVGLFGFWTGLRQGVTVLWKRAAARFPKRAAGGLTIACLVLLFALAYQLLPPARLPQLSWSRAIPPLVEAGELESVLKKEPFTALQGGAWYEQYRAYLAAGIALRDRSAIATDSERLLHRAAGAQYPVGVRLLANLGLAKVALAARRFPEAEDRLNRAAQLTTLNTSTLLKALYLLDVGEICWEARLLDQPPEDTATKRGSQMEDAAWTALVNLPSEVLLPQLAGLSGRALTRFAEGDLRQADELWAEVANRAENAAPTDAVEEYGLKALRGDALNNRSVILMNARAWPEALELLEDAASLPAGAVWRTRVNRVICHRWLGNIAKARELADDLGAPEIPAVHAVRGALSATQKEQLRLYGAALGRTGPLRPEDVPGVVDDLCRICEQDFPGLRFDPEFFELPK